MPGIDRYLDILNLFTVEKSVWTVPEVSDELGLPSSTVYRTMRELRRVNMLHAATEAQYRLGPAFLEFERRTRLTDPLALKAESLMGQLVHRAQIPCTALLARLYGNTVMCVADSRSHEGGVESSYERGRPMPLTRGATSRAILAQLPSRRLGKILETASPRIPASRRSAFRIELARIRKAGYAIAHGEVDKEHVGIAVPLSIAEESVAASLSLVVHERQWNDETQSRLVLLLVSSASLLQQQLISAAGRKKP
jgi:DNA-binding IclR family transcriptional regulator